MKLVNTMKSIVKAARRDPRGVVGAGAVGAAYQALNEVDKAARLIKRGKQVVAAVQNATGIGKRKRKIVKLRVRKGAAKRGAKRIRAIVKNELQRDSSKGVYRKAFVGEMLWHNISTNKQVVVDNGKRGNANSGIYSTTNMAFTPFHVFKLIDAASVVYNGKIKSAVDWNGNLGQNFSETGLVVDFIHCSFSLKIFNQSEVPYEVSVHKGTAKRSHSVRFYDAWQYGIDSMPWRQGKPSVDDIGEKPSKDMKDLVDFYSFETSKFILKPGESRKMVVTFKGVVNFADAKVGGTLQNFMRKVSQSWVFVAVPLASLQYKTSTTPVEMLGLVGQDNGNATGKGIVYEQKEVYVIRQPDDCDDANEGDCMVQARDYPPWNSEFAQHHRWHNDGKNEYNNNLNNP
jgi:hypothetical protein